MWFRSDWPWSPRRGSWPGACWPETRQCRLSLQPHQARVESCGTLPGCCWLVPPGEQNHSFSQLLTKNTSRFPRFPVFLVLLPSNCLTCSVLCFPELKSSNLNFKNLEVGYLRPPQWLFCRIWPSAAACQQDLEVVKDFYDPPPSEKTRNPHWHKHGWREDMFTLAETCLVGQLFDPSLIFSNSFDGLTGSSLFSL